MPAVKNPITGKWELDYEIEDRNEQRASQAEQPAWWELSGEELSNRLVEQDRRAEDAKRLQYEQESAQRAQEYGDDRPLIGWNTIKDVGIGAVNALAAIPTDILDLGASVVKGTQEVYDAARAGSIDAYDLDRIWDDSQNPWTRWRRESFRTETKTGQFISNFLRIGVGVVGFSKIGAAIQGARGVAGAGKAAKAGSALGKWAQIVDNFDDVAKGFSKSQPAFKAATKVAKNPGLYASFDDVARGIAKGGGDDALKGVAQYAANQQQAFRSFFKWDKLRARNLAEAVAWDSFVSFNAAGEGDLEFDETLGDLAANSGLEWLEGIGSLTATDPTDESYILKAKQFAENMILGGVFEAVFDYMRIANFARNFRKANAEDKARILTAFGEAAEDIGGNIGQAMAKVGQRELVEQGYQMAQSIDPLTLLDGNRNLSPLDRLAADVGDLRGLNEAQLRQMRNEQLFVPPGGALLPGGPEPPYLLNRQGLSAPNPLYSDSSGATQALPGAPRALPGAPGPAGLLEPPRGNPDLPRPRPGRPQGMVIGSRDLPGTDPDAAPRPRFNAGLEPGAATDYSVSQGPLDRARQFREVVANEPPAPEPRFNARPPEPVASSELVAKTFAEEMDDAFARSIALGGEAPDVPKMLKAAYLKVDRVTPRTRADMIEYAQKYRPVLNQYGVMKVSDSIWFNTYINRGLDEGWVDIDPATMEFRVNRRAAVTLDRGDLARNQNAKIDEARRLKMFEDDLPASQQTVDVQAQQVQSDAMAQPGAMAQPAALPEAAALPEPSQSMKRANREAVEAVQQAKEYDVTEAARVARGREDPISVSQLTDEEVVREYLPDYDLAEAGKYAPSVQKGEKGGWELIDPEGGIVDKFRTRQAAQKAADKYQSDFRQRIVSIARKREADGSFESFDLTIGGTEYTDQVVGKVTLTGPQMRNIAEDMPELMEQFGDLAEIKKQRTIELNQARMKEVADRIRGKMEEQGVNPKTAQGRAMIAAADKLDAAADALAPEARRTLAAQRIADRARQFIENGSFC